MKDKTSSLRLMQRYEAMRKNKIPGKVIIATARKVATIIWHMLSEDTEFDIGKMVDQKLMKKAEAMSNSVGLATTTLKEHQEKPKESKTGSKREKTPGVAREKRKKVGKGIVRWLTFYRRRRRERKEELYFLLPLYASVSPMFYVKGIFEFFSKFFYPLAAPSPVKHSLLTGLILPPSFPQ